MKKKIIVIEQDLLFSQAYLELSGAAAKVLCWFLVRRQLKWDKAADDYRCTNNGKIVFPYREAEERFRLLKNKFTRALDDLIKKGFLDINHHGGGVLRDPTTYFISERWREYGSANFIKKSRSTKNTRKTGFQKTKKPEEKTVESTKVVPLKRRKTSGS